MKEKVTLTGTPLPVTISMDGCSLQAPDLIGTVIELPHTQSKTRGDSGMLSDRFDRALGKVDIQKRNTFEVIIEQDQASGRANKTRTPSLDATTREGEPAIVLYVPHPGKTGECVVLYTDEAGVSRWIWPQASATKKSKTRGSEEELAFHLPRTSAPIPVTEQLPKTRGPLTKLGRRVVRVLVWGTDAFVGAGARAAAAHWEGSHRPYAFRPFPALTNNKVPWKKLQSGRALLLVHGTFSSGASAFADLSATAKDSLVKRYEGRVFAFDHPTMHHSPRENVQTFFEMLPPDTTLELDILTHSRGGLVGRELIEHQSDCSTAGRDIRVCKAVLVAAPNVGTILADGDHGIDLLDRYTNLLTDLPDDAFSFTIEGVLALVKIMAHGALEGLPGLNCMLPGGKYVKRLNGRSRCDTEYYAVASNFVPSASGLLARMGTFVAGKFLSSVFGEDNDGVVPMRGCYDGIPRVPAFPIPTERRLLFRPEDQVHHCNYFRNPELTKRLLRWLSA